MRLTLIALGSLLALWWASTCLYTVDRAEYVYVTQFGSHVATYDGAHNGGLHVKLPWPIQTVLRVDSRLQFFDLPETELLTHDPQSRTVDKTITVVFYVCWRIADTRADGWTSVDQFIRRVGRREQARTILGEQLRSRIGAFLCQRPMEFLFNTDAGKIQENLTALSREVLEGKDQGETASLGERARQVYGIEIVDIRLRRANHPQAVREAIFARIRSEREKRAQEYLSEGEQLAEQIKSRADRQAREIVAEAEAKEKEQKGLAEAEADRIRNEAHARDPEFYAFLKKLEEYQRILSDNKTVLLLSSHRELFDLLFQPPKPGMSPASPDRKGLQVDGDPVKKGKLGP